MFCSTGIELYEQYQTAEKERDAFNIRKAVKGKDGGISSRELQQAKQRYVLHFANWLSHKAFCQDCKPKAPFKGEHRSTEPGR